MTSQQQSPANWKARYLATVGQLLRERLARDICRVQMARMLRISRRTFQRYESGELDPPGKRLFRWADLLGVELASNLTPGGQ